MPPEEEEHDSNEGKLLPDGTSADKSGLPSNGATVSNERDEKGFQKGGRANATVRPPFVNVECSWGSSPYTPTGGLPPPLLHEHHPSH